MAFTLSATKQKNIAVNKARHLIFFEGSDVVYNYKTQQWTDCTAYTDIGMYSHNNKNVSIGLVRFSSGSVDLQGQSVGFVAQTAIIATGATDPNREGRTVVNGVRPLVSGGSTVTVRVGVQDSIGGAVTYSSAITPHSRTGMAPFRSEGRYVRIEVTLAGGFTTALGVDIDFAPQAKV